MWSLRALLAVLIAAAAALGVLYLITATTDLAPTPEPVPAPVAGDAEDTQLAAEAEERRLLMQTAYADLERDRLMLNQQLGALNTRLWGMRLPSATAKTVQNEMMTAKKLLTNPPMLGAFADTAAIERERERVQVARERLIETEARLFPK